MVILTEDYLLKLTYEDFYVEELDLSKKDITEIDSNAFANFQNLHTIKLNQNKLQKLPSDMCFHADKWWRLDLSDNLLEGLDSLSPLFRTTQFEELLIEGNVNISVDDEHKLMYHIQTLRRINDKPVDTFKLGEPLTVAKVLHLIAGPLVRLSYSVVSVTAVF